MDRDWHERTLKKPGLDFQKSLYNSTIQPVEQPSAIGKVALNKILLSWHSGLKISSETSGLLFFPPQMIFQGLIINLRLGCLITVDNYSSLCACMGQCKQASRNTFSCICLLWFLPGFQSEELLSSTDTELVNCPKTWMKLNGLDNLQLLYRNQIILDTK